MLLLLAGLATAGRASNPAFAAQNVAPAGSVKRVAVVGAGMVGAAIAYNLSKRGCDVILLDKQEPAAQASGNSFAWINASYFDTPKSYYTLREHALTEHHHLAQELKLPTHWGGGLEWYHSAGSEEEVVDGVQRIQDLRFAHAHVGLGKRRKTRTILAAWQ